MKRLLLLARIALALCCVAADWKVAEPGWAYEFPRDHHSHPEFKTEWWYFTGNLFDSTGRRFGYQLTFFRQGIRSPNERTRELSRFVTGDLKFAHFTVTDAAADRFYFQQKTSRGAYGEGGFDRDEHLAWIDTWDLQMDERGVFHLHADGKEAAIDLQLESIKPPAIHGQNGVSQKASSEGHASHYYSLTRLTSAGEVAIGGKRFAVKGDSWFDHEWATNQLAPEQVGWDWLSVHFDDGTELMLYQLRLENGMADPSSSGSLIATDGTVTFLPGTELKMRPTEFWESKVTHARYPIAWQIELPQRGLEFSIRPLIKNQELTLLPLAYWEGAVDVTGTRAGTPIKGRGYLELTGYAGALRELQR